MAALSWGEMVVVALVSDLGAVVGRGEVVVRNVVEGGFVEADLLAVVVIGFIVLLFSVVAYAKWMVD